MSEKIDENSINDILTSPSYNMVKRKDGHDDKQHRYDVYNDW